MGWLSGWHNRGDLVRHLKEGTARTFRPVDEWNKRSGWYEHKIQAACFVGNNMWTVHRIVREFAETPESPIIERKESVFIVLFLLRKFPGGCWGYKDIEENMGPCEVNCPLAYLEMAPDPDGEYGKDWRERVRQHHARVGVKLVVGDRVKLRSSSVKEVEITSVRPLRGRDDNGRTWRIPRKLLDGKAEPATV